MLSSVCSESEHSDWLVVFELAIDTRMPIYM